MSYDMDMCEAITHENRLCPLREECKRFILGQKALMEDYYPIIQGITAHSRELEPRRQRDLQEIAGDLMNRVKL